MTQKHAPLPWTNTENRISDARGAPVADADFIFCNKGQPHIDNADFIVVACNSHYALLEACELAIEGLSAGLQMHPELFVSKTFHAALEKCREAAKLAKAYHNPPNDVLAKRLLERAAHKCDISAENDIKELILDALSLIGKQDKEHG